MIKKLVLLLLLVGIAGGFSLQNEVIQDRLLTNIAKQRMAGNSETLFSSDSLNVMLCGSASPFPSVDRAGPCVAVFVDDRFYIIDTGMRSWNNLALRGVPAKQLGGVFLTHFHSDHIAELGEYNMQSWAAGRAAPLPVFGGPGVDQVVAGFELAYQHDRGYRTAHHGAALMNPDIARMQPQPIETQYGPMTILERGDLKVTAFPVEHDPIRPALGYRFDYRDRAVVISGDTIKTAKLIAAAQGADLLFHEAQAQHMVEVLEDTARDLGNDQLAQLMFDIRDYHSSAIEAAEVANAAGVQQLVLYHLTPPPPNFIAERIFLRGVNEVRKEGVKLGRDGLFYRLPVDSRAIDKQVIEPL